MKNNERIIWQNIDIDIKDYEEFLQEEYPGVTSDYDKQQICYELNDEYLDDERINLESLNFKTPVDFILWFES